MLNTESQSGERWVKCNSRVENREATEIQSSPCEFEGWADTKENLSVLNEFHGNRSLGNLRGMGAGKETRLG